MTVKLSVRNSGWWEFVKPLRECESFVTSGALRGKPFYGPGDMGYAPMGQLMDALALDIRLASKYGQLEYIVYSYQTPIAWKAYGSWRMNEDHYSVTTTRHQNLIGTALSKIDDMNY